MDGLNQVTLIGSVGKDAETKLFGDNSQKVTFSLATNRSYKDKDGAKKTQTEWHNIEVWGDTAKFAGEYVKKGGLVLILGQIRYEKFDKEGVTQYRTKIVADKIQLFPKGGANATATADVSVVTGVAETTASKQTEEYANAISAGFDLSKGDDLPF